MGISISTHVRRILFEMTFDNDIVWTFQMAKICSDHLEFKTLRFRFLLGSEDFLIVYDTWW